MELLEELLQQYFIGHYRYGIADKELLGVPTAAIFCK